MMKKRLTALLLAFALTLALLPAMTASAAVYSGKCGDKLTWTLNTESGALEIVGTGDMPNWSWYTDVPWDSYRSVIKSVSIGKGVTSIGGYAFYLCTEMTSAALPGSLKRIEEAAFRGCSGLTDVTIPGAVTFIGTDAFLWCTGLESVTLPAGVTSIGESAFTYCTALKEFRVDKSNRFYCNDESGILFNKDKTTLVQAPGTFSGSYSIPDSVTHVGTDAFRGCEGLTSITFPDSVKSIGAGAFIQCSGLTDLTIPDSVIDIGVMTFWDCDGLISVSVGNGVMKIPYEVFSGCDRLRNVTFGESVTVIDIRAFRKCSALESITFTNRVKRVDTQAFDLCGSLKDVYFRGTQEDWKAIEFGSINECLTEAKLHFLAPPPPSAGKFSDVSKTAWYYKAVDFAVKNQLMNGVSDGEFRPDDPMTRAMLVTVLWRYEGAPTAGKSDFSDLTADWYKDAVAWAAKNEIVNGVGNGKFDPNGNITREQMAAILYRYAQKKGFDTTAQGNLNAFPDAAKVSSYATDAIAWTVGEGIINGNGGRLDPQGNATRAQVATILMRFIENIAKK